MKELITNISHDLKTPLHVMSINLETLSGLSATQNDADYQHHVRVAYQKNLDLQRLIGNLFEVSRIETDRIVYTPEWQSVYDVLSQVKEKYASYIEGNGISFEIDVEDDIEISLDPVKIWSVFDNIIYNAVRHSEHGGSITITASNTDSSATFIVTDTGCGIEPKHLPRIFERFYKGSQERSANEGESGLGLYIVKSIMEGCGGSVSIESEQGKGASVILNFPAKPKI
jgi:signal transduction histidine kinase